MIEDTRKLFFALWPDARQRDRLRDVIGAVSRDVEGTTIDRRNWHVTLAYLGQFDSAAVPALLARAAQIEVTPFRLAFDRLEYWPRQKLACLTAATGPDELHELVRELNGLIQEFGVVPEDRTYRPHITVSRSARNFATQRLAQRTTMEWSGFELLGSISQRGVSSYIPLKQ